MKAQQLNGAIGNRDCDYIKLENQFARVRIERFTKLVDGTGAVEFDVSGDTPDRRSKRFSTAGAAYAFALESLGAFVAGRTD